jgi:hypothetical protein
MGRPKGSKNKLRVIPASESVITETRTMSFGLPDDMKCLRAAPPPEEAEPVPADPEIDDPLDVPPEAPPIELEAAEAQPQDELDPCGHVEWVRKRLAAFLNDSIPFEVRRRPDSQQVEVQVGKPPEFHLWPIPFFVIARLRAEDEEGMHEAWFKDRDRLTGLLRLLQLDWKPDEMVYRKLC